MRGPMGTRGVDPDRDSPMSATRKPTRKQIETTLDVLGWLASGDQDGQVKDDIGQIRHLLDILLEVGW